MQVPSSMLKALRLRAVQQDTNVREILLGLIADYLGKKGR